MKDIDMNITISALVFMRVETPKQHMSIMLVRSKDKAKDDGIDRCIAYLLIINTITKNKSDMTRAENLSILINNEELLTIYMFFIEINSSIQ